MNNLKSYLKFLSRNKFYTFIEFFGLVASFAFTILIFGYAKSEFSTVANEPKKDNLYAIGGNDFTGMTYSTIDHLIDRLPEIKDYTRVCIGYNNTIAGEEAFSTSYMAVDNSFFKLFNITFIEGDRESALISPLEIIITKSFANKAFGQEGAMGKIVILKNIYGKDIPLVVSGIIENNINSIFKNFDFLISINEPTIFAEEDFGSHMDQFSSVETFVLLDNINREEVTNKLHKAYIDIWPNLWDKDPNFLGGVSLTRLDEIYFSPLGTNFKKGEKKKIYIIVFAGLILLASAIFNYINLTVSQTGFRAKEFATRRLLGASKMNICLIFFIETLIFIIICFSSGFLLAYTLLPYCCSLLSTEYLIWENKLIYIEIYTLIIFLITILATIIPLIYVLRFKPIDVVKGNFRFRSKMFFSKIFIVIQNVITIVLITVALTMNIQMNYLINLPKGYESKDLILIPTNNCFKGESRKNKILLDKLTELPMVEMGGLASSTPFYYSGLNIIRFNDKAFSLRLSNMDSTCFKMIGIKVIDSYSDITINKTYYTLNAQNKIGFTSDEAISLQYPACGIIQDYRYGSSLNNIYSYNDIGDVNAIKIIPHSYEWISQIVLKVNGDKESVIKAVQERLNSGIIEIMNVPLIAKPYYVDDFLSNSLKETKNIIKIVTSFMIVSIIISLLGLSAMSIYFTRQRSKEIAIRKIYGSTIAEVIYKISISFIYLIIGSIVLSLPISIYICNKYLETFPYRIDLYWWIIILSILIAIIISLTTMYYQIIISANKSPIKSLVRAF